MASVVMIRNEMQSIVRSAAEPWTPGDSVKAALQRSSQRIGLPYRRVRSLWYGQCDVWAHEADHLRAFRRMSDQQKEQRLREELRALQARIGTMNAEQSTPAPARLFVVERRQGSRLGGGAGTMDRRQTAPEIR